MVKIIDLSDDGLTLEQLLESARWPAGVLLRRDGAVVARLESADDAVEANEGGVSDGLQYVFVQHPL